MTLRSSSRRVLPARWGAGLVVLVALSAEDPVRAQQAATRPAGWQLRTDDPAQPVDSVAFADMAPGWHITTGPAVILYHPDSTASGDYRVDVETFLFDPGDRREGFGIFFGGQDLDGADQRYGYFLVRQDGRYIVKKREGADTPTLRVNHALNLHVTRIDIRPLPR